MSKIQIKPQNRGLLHTKLGMPKNAKIPKDMLLKAAKSRSPALRKEAQFAINFGHRDRHGNHPHDPGYGS